MGRAAGRARPTGTAGARAGSTGGRAPRAPGRRSRGLVGVDAERVAVGSTVSELVGSVVTALPAGARVVVPDIEFTSTLFPLLVQQRLDVRTVPPAELADAIGDGADAVAFSAVQMSTGEVADLDAILAAAASVGAITLCDATQALGWLPLRPAASTPSCAAAYKWLMSPRGSAFLAVSDRLLETRRAPQRRLVRRRGCPCQLLRPAAAPGLERASAGCLARRGSPGSGPSRRWS